MRKIKFRVWDPEMKKMDIGGELEMQTILLIVIAYLLYQILEAVSR
ncbi:hypothetical protein [Selenomonas noxia]|nr:hypothetical protein [Selenomonas noxia]